MDVIHKILVKCILFLSLAVCCGGSCEKPKVRTLTLSKKCEVNRVELEKTLTHYSEHESDSLKFKAALFLINNMPGHFYYDGKLIAQYDQIYNWIQNREKTRPFVGSIHYPEIYAFWDSLQNIADTQNLNMWITQDCETITADLLIENIDYAFLAWKFPWSRHLSFKEFCEYILPYRFDHERVESWRPDYMKRYSWLVDSMKGSTDPVKASTFINNAIKSEFRFNEVFFRYPSAISPKNLIKGKMGKCLDQAGFANFAMRAMGIPVVHESILQWADRSMGHDFSAVLTTHGKFIDFLGGELPPGKNEIRNVAPKIYRVTYGMTAKSDSSNLSSQLSSASVLHSQHLLDVTKNYIPVTDVRIQLDRGITGDNGFIYLAVFNNSTWVPVATTRLIKGRAIFKDVGRNAVYLPMVYDKGKLVPAQHPISINKKGIVSEIIADSTKSEIVNLARKYPLNGIKIWWMTLMGGGKFQASNSLDFKNAVTIFTIPDTIKMQMNVSPVHNNGKFRYLRYLFPNNKSGSLGELAFYSNAQLVHLSGKPIKSQGVDSSDLSLAFDGKFDQFIDRTPNNQYNGQWIGMDLGKATRIHSVGYSPRNDRNNIMAGMDYELFFWKGKWESLGRTLSKSDKPLVFKNVPRNALLLLHNHSEGQEERIFVYSKNKQIWW